jgi:flagellar basal-body rod modification protein FlgD
MSTSAISSSSSSSSANSSSSTNDALNNVKVEDFLKLLLTELQNQDPMEPTDSNQILQQVSQIKAIQSNQKLSDTLSSMQLQQNFVTAGSLLQKTITGLTDDGESVSGKVDKITFADNAVKVCVGEKTISLGNISEIDPAS